MKTSIQENHDGCQSGSEPDPFPLALEAQLNQDSKRTSWLRRVPMYLPMLVCKNPHHDSQDSYWSQQCSERVGTPASPQTCHHPQSRQWGLAKKHGRCLKLHGGPVWFQIACVCVPMSHVMGKHAHSHAHMCACLHPRVYISAWTDIREDKVRDMEHLHV